MALPKQRKIVRPPVVDTTKPQKDCAHCLGLGCHPDGLLLNPPMYIRINSRIHKGPRIPCQHCFDVKETSHAAEEL